MKKRILLAVIFFMPATFARADYKYCAAPAVGYAAGKLVCTALLNQGTCQSPYFDVKAGFSSTADACKAIHQNPQCAVVNGCP